MIDKQIADRSLDEWIQKHPLISGLIARDEVVWCNPRWVPFASAQPKLSLSQMHIKDAEERLNRFAPYVARVFPETQREGGIIDSPLISVPALQRRLSSRFGGKVVGSLLLKCDNQLAVSGSIKARGGIYEVLKYAEDLAVKNGLLTFNDDYSILDSERAGKLFSQYSLAVGSTGNLGLSIGIMGAQLGFQVVVHMSSEAKQWKKNMLHEKGVTVIEHASDYSRAVEEGRRQADFDPNMHFVDDENSTDLFLGYSVAASRLERQLKALDITVDATHPLFVYLPCGVGGGPGGITFGLKQVFKDSVHCFFAEPTAAPSMLLGLMTGRHNRISVRDIGLNNVTAADGLAVARPSGFVGRTLEQMIGGVFTVKDASLFDLLRTVLVVEKIPLEPSAVAGMPGPFRLINSPEGDRYLASHGLQRHMPDATHIVWATGGSMVPPEEMAVYYDKGSKKR